MQTLLISQVVESKLSKHGKTSLSGIFEGLPQNALVGTRNYSVPAGDYRLDSPIDAYYSYTNKQAKATTYLEHLQREGRI